jgi:hypothetical protein
MYTVTVSADLTAIDHSPGEAIMAGFSLVAADNPSLGPALRAAARKAADEFVAAVEHAPRGTRERQYLDELLMAAVSFAAGLTRRQQERNQRVQAAEEERKLNFRRVVQTQRLGGILRGGIQLLLLGGFAYFLVRAVFGTRWMPISESGNAPRDYTALATALASSLIGSFVKAWYTGWRINQVDRRYKDALREAKEIYHAEAVQEYEFAAQEANLAWQKFTGRAPAITDAFRVLILGLLAGEKGEFAPPKLAKPARGIQAGPLGEEVMPGDFSSAEPAATPPLPPGSPRSRTPEAV